MKQLMTAVVCLSVIAVLGAAKIKVRVEPDPEARLELYRRAEDIIFDDCPSVWHYFPAAIDVRQPYVKGVRRHPVRGLSLTGAWLDSPEQRASP